MQAIKRLNVNMVDLEHQGHLGKVDGVERFPTEVALSEYSRRSGRLYRKELVPRKSLLKSLQRHIQDSRPEQGKKCTDNRKKNGEMQERVESNQSKGSG